MADASTFSVIITGGQGNQGEDEGRVTRYNKWGHVEDLPSLLSSRSQHGCASYRIADSLVR